MIFKSISVWVLLLFCCNEVMTTFPSMQTTTFDGVPENWYPDADTGPFVKIGEKYYWIETNTKVNWFEAAHICRTKNANLASIETDSEFNALKNYIRKQAFDLSNSYWLSANNLIEDQKYYWLGTGKPMTYTKWAPGKPDRFANSDHCVSLWYNRNDFSMNDFDCKAFIHFVCEANTPKTVSFTMW